MNRGVYRLIFNCERNVFVAVAEHVRGRGKKASRRRATAALLGLAAIAAGSCDPAIAAPPATYALPVPSHTASRPFVFAGTVTGGQPSTVGNAMTINTASRTLGLNWQSFDIGSSASVTFNQPDATSRVLNRIWSNDPSQIMGKLNANGQVYLINQNGILFGAGAQVNVGGLVASALSLSESMSNRLLNSGLPLAKGDSLEFAWGGNVAGFNAGSVMVEAGAAIRTPSGGRVVLIAPKTVENLGLIQGGGGAEAILAAGGKVILTAPDDPALRGLLVETKSFTGKDALGNNVSLDGTVTNSGRIDTGTGGTVSLAALAVNQKGLVNATKAVNLNGTTMLVSGSIQTDLLTINQRGSVAQIDWVSGFNVGAGKKFELVQSSAGDVLYNYVYDSDRTTITGLTLQLANSQALQLANNSMVTLAAGPTVTLTEKSTLNSDRSTMQLAEKTQLTLNKDTQVTLANGKTVLLAKGSVVTLLDKTSEVKRSENMLEVAAGLKMTLANNSMLNLADAPIASLSDKWHVELTAGSAMTLVSAPSTLLSGKAAIVTTANAMVVSASSNLSVKLANGSEATLAVGSALNLGAGSSVSLAGSKVALASGSKMSVNSTSKIALSNGSTVKLADRSAVILADKSSVRLADGSTLKLFDGSAAVTLAAGRSSIDGLLKASGQFVLINEKGIDFGVKANVSASNFVASALGMNSAIVDSGLLGQINVATRAFYLNKNPTAYSEVDPNLSQVVDEALGAVRQATVEVKSGAQIKSSRNGYVILAGLKVDQAGSIISNGGQALLAAGADIYLKPGYSSAVRGFTAEVNPFYMVRTGMDSGQVDGNGNPISAGDTNKTWLALSRGSDANSVINTGTISAPFGDITLVGHEISQAGTLKASTSATANGSIHLVARDQVNIGGEGEPVAATFWRQYGDQGMLASTPPTSVSDTADNVSDFVIGLLGGKLTFAAGSRTVVEIDGSNGKTLTADQTFVKSSIDAMAKQIVVADADIEARGGNIRLRASEQFNEFSAFAVDAPVADKTAALPAAGVGIFVADGAHINAAGTDAAKSVADLFIEVELRGDEFADNPVQRNGKLRGEKVWVDIRDKVSIAKLDGWINNVGQTVFEKAASGGEISLGSTGSVIVKAGSELNVSGGKVDYAAATVQETSALTQGGQRYRLNDAPVSAVYAGLVTAKRKESAYVEGKSAGTVELSGHSLAVDGKLTAKTTVGTRQRELGDPVGNRYALPYGGRLIVRDAGQHYTVPNRETATDEEKAAAYTQAQIVFISGAAKAAAELSENSAAGPRLELSTALVDAGFSRFDIGSDGRIDIPADVRLSLPAGGSFAAAGRQIYVAGDISAPGGSIVLKTSALLDSSLLSDAKFMTLTLDAGASLSTAGVWVNDYLDGRLSKTAKAINGGSISLTSAYDLDLREGSSVDVSGGGWINYKGTLTSGNAGSIALATGGVDGKGFMVTEDGDRRDASLFIDGKLSGYALGKGGTLTIKTSAIRFGETFSEDSRNWSREQRLAAGQVGAAFDAGFVDQGGFFSFNFVGRDGVTVADGVHLSPDPLNWSLASVSNYRYRPTGSALKDFAQSLVLNSDLRRAPTNLSLATRSREYGDLLVGENAYLGVSAQGSINLVSLAQLTVLGTLEAPAGKISLSRPATRDYDEKILVAGEEKGVFYNVPIEFSESKQSESIYLGPNGRILAGGTTVLTEATRLALASGVSADFLLRQSRYRGSVLDGGTVIVDAGLGYLVTRSGSLIDVSGTVATLNMPKSAGSGLTYPAFTVGSAGGSVNFVARDGIFLDGAFSAKGGEGALGGSFALRFADVDDKSNPWDVQKAENSDYTPEQLAVMAERQLTLYQSSSGHADTWPATVDNEQYLAGAAKLDPVAFNGKASLDLASLVSGGFGSWSLTSQNEMRFSGDISATVNNQLKLNAPKFSAADDSTSLVLKAAAAQIGNLNTVATATVASIGGATASISALDIGLIGTFDWNGFGTSKFASQGEIHFDSVGTSGSNYKGQMSASGDLTFSAARLSPSTSSNFRVDLLADSNGSIAITRPAGAVADVSLSAGGRLELAALNITHDGTISAPLGEIVFNAPGGKVTLGSGSITSVAADRALLFGYTTESGTAWKYLGSEITAMPSKGIRIDAADTVVASGAKLDLSGGGDALAWEFTAGPGGKNDVLAASTAAFAIIPGWNGFTATDGELQQGYLNATDDLAASLKAGDRISLASNPAGLSGSYVLLPARYAVLPGAYLVSVKSSKESVLSGAQIQADGSWLVSGQRLAANADGTTTAYFSAALTLELASAGVVAKRATYTTTTASQFFYDVDGAKLAGDAGQLTAIGRNSLVFDPSVVAMRVAEISAADGRKRAGRGLELDLAAPKLLVSDGNATTEAGWSRLDQNKLNALGASSLLIGGARTVSGTTTNIESVATDVKISNSKSALSAAELLLTATKNLMVAGGSRIESKGSAEARDIVLSGDGAFLRVAEGAQALLGRTDGSVSRTQGDLNIEAGASVAGQSLIFDATRDNKLDGKVVLGTRQSDGSRKADGAIAIGAGRLNVVADGSRPADGLTLDNAYLARFATADQLRLASYSTLDLYGNAVLGAASLKDLVIAAGGIAGHGGAGSLATIAAQRVSFTNPKSGAVFTTSDALGYGGLNVQAASIEFGDNATAARREAETAGFNIRGFANVDLVATGDVRFSGSGVTTIDNVGGNGQLASLNIDAGRVVTVGTADHLLQASGATTISRNRNAAGAETDAGLGGSLELRGKSLDVSGKVDIAAGDLTLAGTDYLTILKNAFIGAEGRKVAFDDTYAYASGGTVTLKSDEGKVTVSSGAVVSVSADAGGGDAGSLALLAPKGEVSAAAGTLRGSASSDAEQGAFKVDAKSVSLDALADAVIDTNGKQHFTGSWDVRRRSGDLALNKKIKAQAVRLAADAGNIDIAGTIDASGSKGGKIELYANRADGVGGWVNLLAGSMLKAYATESVGTGQGTKGQGGTVIVGVSATAAADELDTGINFAGATADKVAASIDVSTAEGSAADKGKVTFRAPRQDTLGNLIGFDGAVIVSNDTLADVMATSYLVTPSATISSLGWGTALGVRLSASNLGQATLNLNGLGSKNVLNADGSALLDGALVSTTAGKVLVFDGVSYRISPTAASSIPASPATALLTAGAYKVSGSAPVAWGLVSFKAGASNTATTKLKIGVKDYSLLDSNGKSLAAGTIKANQSVLVVFDGTAFRLSPTTPTLARTVNLAIGPTTTQYQVDSAVNVAALVPGSVITFAATSQAKAGATLKLGGNDAKLLLNADGSPLVSEVKSGSTVNVPASFEAGQGIVAVYDGTAFRISTVALKDAGTIANTYKVTPAQKPVSDSEFKTEGYTLTFRARQTNTTAAKLTVVTEASSSGTTVNLKRADGSALEKGEIQSNQLLTVAYTINDDGIGEFRLVGGTELASAPVTNSTMAKVSLAGNVSGAASVALEAVNTTRKNGDVLLGAEQQGFLLDRTAQAAALKADVFVAAADTGGRLGVVFRPGEEIRATGDISIGSGWDFSAARYQNQPGSLALRADGDLNINGSLSDGFGGLVTGDSSFQAISRDAKLASTGDSWSFRLVAGADSAQASPLATKVDASKGSIFVGANRLVRTGTGSIDMAASKDIKLFDRAAVYTAGIDAATQPDGFVAAAAQIKSGPGQLSAFSMFPSGGGDISLTAGERILMVKNGESKPDERHINEWLFRAGGKSANLQWWSRIASFQQGVAAFGGGDIAVTAGKEINNLTVAIPTNGRVPRINGENQPDSVVVQGGGDLNVSTAGAVTGGQFYVETGVLQIDAGALKSNVGIALGNSLAKVNANGDIELGNVFNPLWVVPRYVSNTYNGTKRLASSKGVGQWSTASTADEYEVRFGTYGENTTLDVVSTAGDVALNSNDKYFGLTDSETHRLMPSKVKVAALNGDIEGSVTQAPGENGQLDLLAQGSITLKDGFVAQLDVPVELLPSVRNPLKNVGTNGRANFQLFSLLKNGSSIEQHSATGWHVSDAESSRLIALAGDIKADIGDFSLFSTFNEAVRIKAGGDVSNLNLSVQHAHASDVSSIVAGGDIRYDYQTVAEPGKVKAVTDHYLGINVTGPGGIEVVAGKSIDLADSGGIVTRGNLENPYLPEGGATIMVAAGATPDYDSLRAFLKVGKEIGDAALRQRFFKLLRDYGKEAQATGDESHYEKGRLLAKALFPTEKIGKGDIKLSVSQIKTEQGGGIHAFAPGGSIQVGVAAPALSKKASQQGIFTIRDGEIFAFVANNFLVNQSRVFTLDGGDIMIWANRGNIDAGSGSKTLISTPPPVLVIRDGQIVLDTSNSISGSGIGVLASRDDTPASDMSLFAPEGAIDAGDAGLRSTGNITLGARVILNANNIQAAGSVTGAPAPVAAVAPVVATTSPTNSENKAQSDATSTASKRDGASGILTVEVLDSEPAAPTTTEKSTSPAPKNDDDRKRKGSAAG